MTHHPRLLARIFLTGLAAAALLFSGLSLAGKDIFDPDTEYSAVRVIKTSEGEMTMRVFHARDKERFVVEGGGQNITMITRLDKQVSWILMPDEKMYMEIPMDQASAQMKEMGFGQEIGLWMEGEPPKDFKKMGTETIAGLETTKYKGNFKDEDTGEDVTAYYWITDSGLMAKTEYEGIDASGKREKVVMELRELKIGAQPASLFEPPADYQPFQLNFSQEMKDMFSGMNPPQSEQEDSPDIAAEIAEEAGDEAKSAVKDEVKRSVRDAVRGLFGR